MSQRIPRSAKTAEIAVERLEKHYAQASGALLAALDRYLDTREAPSAAERASFRYPLLRVTHRKGDRPDPTHRRAFGRLQREGVYETTITHPAAFRPYLVEQLHALQVDYGVQFEVAVSDQEIPYPYVLERVEELQRANVTSAELARHFPVPRLSLVGDEIADGQWAHLPGAPRPLALFDAVRVDYSLRRLVHYTGSDWRHVQSWILLTNYHRYIDQFLRWGREQLAGDGPYTRMVLPGNIVLERGQSPAQAEALVASCEWHRFQMPAYHLAAPGGEGVTLVNIGVGPSNAKNITDHLAVVRPNCWLMVGHCGGLRDTQKIGDYVLAHGYLRQDRILDALVPPEVPIPALAEIQVALQDAAQAVTGATSDTLKGLLRTGTVVTNDDRNWELRFTQERRRINLSRAIAVDMESGTIAAQGFRLRVPYGTLLCVSDKPLHGELKLPGMATAFYRTQVSQHLQIGIRAIQLLASMPTEALHSRKLRSFYETAFQ